jgi:hypothetical protein
MELGKFKEDKVHIILDDDTPIFTHEVWEFKRPRWMQFPRFQAQPMLINWSHFWSW